MIGETGTKSHPLEVELHVCDRCGSISKVSADYARGGQFFCTGKGRVHKQTRMRPRLFREVVER